MSQREHENPGQIVDVSLDREDVSETSSLQQSADEHVPSRADQQMNMYNQGSAWPIHITLIQDFTENNGSISADMNLISVFYTLWTGLKTLYPHVSSPIHLESQTNTDTVTQEMVDWHPLTIVAKATSSDAPNWNQAMNDPYANWYWDDMVKEVETLTDTDAWVEVAREKWMKVVPSLGPSDLRGSQMDHCVSWKQYFVSEVSNRLLELISFRRMPLWSLGTLSELYLSFQQSTICHHAK